MRYYQVSADGKRGIVTDDLQEAIAVATEILTRGEAVIVEPLELSAEEFAALPEVQP